MYKKIVLGTASLGSSYGVTNFSKKQNFKEVLNIFHVAWEKGVRSFDTAPGYNTEKSIGHFLKLNGLTNKAKIFTKLPNINSSLKFEDRIKYFINNSLKNLNVSKIEVLFFHDPKNIKFIEKNKNFFLKLKKIFPIKNYGFSIYNLSEFNNAKKINLTRTFQVPYNLLNNEFVKNSKNYNFHARSIFFQGLLVSKKYNRRLKNNTLRKSHNSYLNYFKKLNIEPIDYNFEFLKRDNFFKSYLLGVDNIYQLEEFFKRFKKTYTFKKKVDRQYLQSLFSKRNLDARNWS